MYTYKPIINKGVYKMSTVKFALIIINGTYSPHSCINKYAHCVHLILISQSVFKNQKKSLLVYYTGIDG